MNHAILDAIGNTPLVEITRMNPNPGVTILAKLEYMNPGGSIKDRAALFMIREGEKSGELTSDKTVIEATSGNTGIGLALICAVKGYNLVLTMSESASEERKSILKARGAQILLTPGHLGSDAAIEEAYRLARENPDQYFMTDQYNNPANWQAHYHTTAPEIWEQTGGTVDGLIATLGTSGTLMGLSRRLKEFNPDIRIIGAEPYLGHGIQGLKNMKESYNPNIFDKGRLDEKVNIEDEKAFETARRLAREEGLFVGMSSGAAMAVALEEAQKLDRGTLVVILPDSGERYLSTSLFTVKDNITLNLFNTRTRTMERFEPSEQGRATVYTCGPTVHKPMDPGKFRRFVATDLLCRYLEFRKLTVNHVVNITDLDDKTIAGSEAAGQTMEVFTSKHIRTFTKDLAALRVRTAQAYPLVSEHVEEMVRFAGRLVEKGAAYEKLNSLYFDISSLAEYGELSGVDLDKIRIGATVDLDDYEKDNPKDFTLLKRVKLAELKRGVCVNTEWGNVRPSLHLQCAAISLKYLGEDFDIHTGSRELLFPHHENEMAMARAATGKPLARHWMHSEGVLYDGSLGAWELSEFTLERLENLGWDPRTIRYWLIQGHYRKSILLSQDTLADAKRNLNKLDRCVRELSCITAGKPFEGLEQFLYDMRQGFVSAMDDDLKMSGVMTALFKGIKKINILLEDRAIDPMGAARIIDFFKELDSVLRIFKFHWVRASTPEIQALMEERNQARQNKDWAVADKIRDELISLGVDIQDRKV